jgi:uncharacterized surface protein with fasciclin (FAS1) repeats
MKTINKIFRAFAKCSLICTGFFIASCSDNFTSPSTPTGNTITQLAQSTDSLQAFYTALGKTGLKANFGSVNGGQFTVFAPSNYAFVKFLRSQGISIAKTDATTAGALASAAINLLTVTSTPSISTLAGRINYHVISSNLPTSLITGGQVFVTMQGARLSVSKVTGGTSTYVLNANESYNGAKSYFGSNLISFSALGTDLEKAASNGLIHLVDQVMTPVGTSGTPSFSGILSFLGMGIDYTRTTTDPLFITVPSGSTSYNVMATALKKTQFITTLVPNSSPLPDYTLFVPDDNSFVTYLKNKYASAGIVDEATAISFINGLSTSSDPLLSVITDLMKYHTVQGRMLTLDIAATQSTLLASHSITYDNVNFKVIGDATTTPVNTTPIAISAKDQLTNAGIVQVISGVLEHE